MKRFLFRFLFLVIPLVTWGQVATGDEFQAYGGFQNLAPQTILSNPNFLVTSGNDGTLGQIPPNNFLNGRTAQGDTGVLSFAGLSVNSTTSINIGAAVG